MSERQDRFEELAEAFSALSTGSDEKPIARRELFAAASQAFAQLATLPDPTGGDIDTSGFALVGHTHDERYYLKSEVNALLSGITVEVPDHDHNDLYYTESEVDTLLGALPSPPSVAAYETLVFTTGSLASGASETINAGVWGNRGTIWRVRVTSIDANNECWIRVYGNGTQETADSGRTDPANDPDLEVSVLADLLFTPAFLDLDCAPLIEYMDQDHSAVNSRPVLKVTNSGTGSAQAFEITFYIMKDQY